MASLKYCFSFTIYLVHLVSTRWKGYFSPLDKWAQKMLLPDPFLTLQVAFSHIVLHIVRYTVVTCNTTMCIGPHYQNTCQENHIQHLHFICDACNRHCTHLHNILCYCNNAVHTDIKISWCYILGLLHKRLTVSYIHSQNFSALHRCNVVWMCRTSFTSKVLASSWREPIPQIVEQSDYSTIYATTNGSSQLMEWWFSTDALHYMADFSVNLV